MADNKSLNVRVFKGVDRVIAWSLGIAIVLALLGLILTNYLGVTILILIIAVLGWLLGRARRQARQARDQAQQPQHVRHDHYLHRGP